MTIKVTSLSTNKCHCTHSRRLHKGYALKLSHRAHDSVSATPAGISLCSLHFTPVNSCCAASSSAAALKPGQNMHNNSAHVMSSTAAWRTQREGQWEHNRAAREVGCNDDLRTRSRTPAPVHKTSVQHVAHHHHTPAKLHSKARRRPQRAQRSSCAVR